MARLPFLRSEAAGLYQVCTVANTDYPVAVPDNSIGVILWFETSASNSTLIGGRVGVDKTNTAITPITATSTNIGYHPATPVEYQIVEDGRVQNNTYVFDSLYLHLACPTAGAVVRGMWLYPEDK